MKSTIHDITSGRLNTEAVLYFELQENSSLVTLVRTVLNDVTFYIRESHGSGPPRMIRIISRVIL